MALVDAGHPNGYRIRNGSSEELVLEPDFPLGMFAEAGFRCQHLVLQPGDRLLLVSDAVLEAAPEAGEAYGVERLV